MAVETPTNCWTRAEARIMTALSNSEAFQQLCEAVDADEALTHIYGEELASPQDGHAYTTEELVRLRAYGQVYSGDESPYGKQWIGSRHVPFGTVIIYIEHWPTDADLASHRQVPLKLERKFKNRTGDVIDDLIAYLVENSGPFIKDCIVTNGPGTNDPEKWADVGMCQGIEFTLEWGDTSE